MNIKKNGSVRNFKKFFCKNCGHQFVVKKNINLQRNKLWKEYVWGKQTLTQLGEKYRYSPRWVRRQIDSYIPDKKRVAIGKVVAIADATFFGRGYGILVFRCPHSKRNFYLKEIITEKADDYLQARLFLEQKGFVIEAVVVDGKRGLFNAFGDIPVQMCHFHQLAIVRRYLTSRPKLEASIELKSIALTLTISSEKTFTDLLNVWHEKWGTFLKEKTYSLDRKHWQHTHKRIRSAYRSLRTNLPHLFTYQKYPYLNIPNTTNSLDGFFNKLKSLLNIHRGLSPKRRLKLIREILFP